MSDNKKNNKKSINFSIEEEINEIRNIEEKCKLKIKSIQDMERSIEKVNLENEHIKQMLHLTNSRMEEIRDFIVSMDNVNYSLHETLAYLEVEEKNEKFQTAKSRKDHELQLYVKMEQLQKEEERFKNIPEVMDMKAAESELESTKSEYEKLLKYRENLMDQIEKAKIKQCEERNGIIVKFAEAYTKSLSLTKKKNQKITVLRKLEAEYHDKLNKKNLLLKSQQNKPYKVMFCTIDSITNNINNLNDLKECKNLEVLNEDLKPDFDTSKSKYIMCQQKLDHGSVSNKQKKSVTFRLSSDDYNMENTNNDFLNCFKNVNTKLMESNTHNDQISPNNKPNMNMESSISSTYISTEPKTICFGDNKSPISTSGHDFQSIKRKIIEDESSFDYKKPYNSAVDELNSIKNVSNNMKPNQPNAADENFESNLVDNLESVQTSDTNWSINNYTNKSDNNDHNSHEKSAYELKDQNLESSTPNNMMFEESSNVLSGLYLADYGGPHSSENSFCDSEFSEIYRNDNVITQNSYQKSFSSNPNSFNSQSFQELKVVNQLQSRNLFKPFNIESLKMDNISDNTTNAAASTSKINIQPIRPSFVSSAEQFKMNFSD